MRQFRQPKVMVPALLAAAGIAAAIYFTIFRPSAPGVPFGADILPSSAGVIHDMLHKSAPHPKLHLADSRQPVPTNSWYSGPVFAEPSNPAYAYPWSLQTTKTGASLSVPAAKSTPSTVFAEHSSDLKVDVGATGATVGPHDDMSVVINYRKASQEVASSRLTHGSPYVFFTLQNHHASLSVTGSISQRGSHAYIVTVNNQRYGLWLPAGGRAQVKGSTISLNATRFTLIALPAGGDDSKFFAFASNELRSASASYTVNGNASTTTFRLATVNHQPTVFGLLPHQYDHVSGLEPIGELPTLLGQQKFVAGTRFSYTLGQKVPSGKIITRELSSAQTSKLTSLLKDDVNGLELTKTDPYFAGKALYRAANLLELAHELHLPAQAGEVQGKLAAELDRWLDPQGYKDRGDRYFYYDPGIHGIVAAKPSFGNEKFNDHHFQYGYFIYAAAVLGRYDHGFVQKNRAMVDTLVRDIASPAATHYFPKLRNFDPYAGHSWADGYGLFLDGNDQESSSEAVDAWYAVHLWAQTVHNPKLAAFSQWLYQNEANAALTYWLNPDLSSAQFQNYRHQTVGIVWGGKLDYATFFSSKPAAPLGIQLIPMSPGQAYVADNPGSVQRNLAALSGQPIQFKDYLLMYRALADQTTAETGLAGMQPSDLDDANSMTYLYAWVYDR